MADRPGPSSQLHVTLMTDRIVPLGRTHLLAVYIGGDLGTLENRCQVNPLFHGQLGKQRCGGFRPLLAGDAVPMSRSAHPERTGLLVDEDQKSARTPGTAGENVWILSSPFPVNPGGDAHRVRAVKLGYRRQGDEAVGTGESYRVSELTLDPGNVMQFGLTDRIGRVSRVHTRPFVETPPSQQAATRIVAPGGKGTQDSCREDDSSQR